MNKASVLLFTCAAFLSYSSNAQSQKSVKEKCYKTDFSGTSDLATTTSSIEPSHEWEMIKYEDITWKKRVWRTVDANHTTNTPISRSSLGTSFAELLQSGATNNGYRIFYSDHYLTMQNNDVKALVGKYDLSSVTSYRIKEDWIMTKDNKMHVRIIAIAPIFNEEEPPFWFYYPDTRKFLYDHKISGSDIADLEEFFEGRFFNSKIVKEAGGPVSHEHDPTKWHK